jgi:hypothetical protein
MRKSAKRPRRLALTVAVIVAMGVIATGAVISRQGARMKEESNNQAKSPSVTQSANRNYVTVKVAGRDVQVDSQTGQIKELTPEEAQKLAAGLKQVINQSTEGLVQVEQPDGSVTMELDGHFQNVAVARVNEDGTVTQGCVDNAQAAGEFFGIDPQLIDDQSNRSETGRKQPRVKSTRN